MTYINPILPNYLQIINLEKISNKNGSGISYEELLGKWNLQYVWRKGSDKIDNISSSILQILSASLELTKIDLDIKKSNFKIKNRIQFGIISIEFIGSAFLKGGKPLLCFCFTKLIFKIGSLTLVNQNLVMEDPKKMPFFSLIGIDKNCNWLCARGRGGGLAIWIKH